MPWSAKSGPKTVVSHEQSDVVGGAQSSASETAPGRPPLKVAIHQPDLLPWSGFFYKMINCDLFVLAVHDQLQKHWVQRRVMMRETWVTLPLVGKARLIPINETEVREGWQAHLVDSIRGRYVGARHWSTRGGEVCDRVASVEGSNLADINIALMEHLREMLGITTPLTVTAPPASGGVERVLEQLQLVGATTYLSGTGARGYIDEAAEARFAELGISLEWSHHHKTSGDSVITLLMDYDDPMELIALGE